MSTVNITEALAHMDGHEQFQTEEEKPKPEGRDRVRLRPHEMAERRMLMAAMFAKGKYLRTIAKHFNLSEAHVSEEINKLVKAYNAQALESIGDKVAREEALLYMVQLEATEAWFESKQGRIINTKKRWREIKSIGQKMGRAGRKGKPIGPQAVNAAIMARLDEAFGSPPDDPDAPDVETLELVDETDHGDETERHETSPGDPRFLAIILDCIDRRAKLNNLYPTLDGRGGIRSDGMDELENMTPQQRLGRLRSMLDKARMNRAQQLALKGAEAEGTAETLNQQPLKESIFETRARAMVERPTMPQREPVTQPKDLGDIWDATG